MGGAWCIIENAARILGEPTMRHLLLWLLVCVLMSSLVAAEPAWVDPDIIRAYEKVTGKNYADEVAKLTEVQRIPNSESKAKVHDGHEKTAVAEEFDYRGVPAILQCDDGHYADVTVTFDGEIPDLESINPRVKISRVGDKISRWGNNIAVRFPLELLPNVASFPSVSEIYYEGPVEPKLNYSAPLVEGYYATIDSNHHVSGKDASQKRKEDVVAEPAWVDPDIIKAYEKVTGKNFADEVAKLTGAKSTPSRTSIAETESAQEKMTADHGRNASLLKTDDGLFVRVHLEFEGEIPELEAIDPRVEIRRVGDKISRSGNIISVMFPIELLPSISVFPGVKEMQMPGEVVPLLNYSAPIVEGYYVDIDSSHHVFRSDVKICYPQNCY
jgi:hypothetical protein